MTTLAYPNSPPQPAVSLQVEAEVLSRRLHVELPPAYPWGVLITTLLGVASWGLLPLIVWPGHFRRFAAKESKSLKEIGNWAAARDGRPAAASLEDDSGFQPIPGLICVLLAMFTVAAFALSFSHGSFAWANLLAVTYQYHLPPTRSGVIHATSLHRLWVATLTVGYVIHWMQIRAHVGGVRRFIQRVNPVIEAQRLPAVSTPIRARAGGLIWVVAAVVMGLYGVWWGIPMLLAGATRRTYINKTAPRVRRELALRFCDISEGRTLPGAMPPTVAAPARKRCDNERCRASLSSTAQFCNRCGTKVSASCAK